MKMYRLLWIVAPVLGAIMLFCLSLLLTGRVSLATNGFAVDESGLLYVGQEQRIVVMDKGECVRSIRPRTTRGYVFTIVDGKEIHLSTGSTVHIMDLEGSVLRTYEDTGTKLYNELQWKRSFISNDGTEYKLTFPWGRMQICQQEQVIYRMPVLDYIVLLLIITDSILVCVFVVFIVRERIRSLMAHEK